MPRAWCTTDADEFQDQVQYHVVAKFLLGVKKPTRSDRAVADVARAKQSIG